MKPLSNRHMAFIDEYMQNGRNATAAYASVYPKASRKTAESNGFLLLQKTEVIQELEKREAELREKNKVTVEMLTQKLLEIATNASEFAPSASVSALKLIAQIHGLDAPKENAKNFSTEQPEIKITIVNNKEDGNQSNENIPS